MEANKVNSYESSEKAVGSSLVTTSSLPPGVVQLSHCATAVLPLAQITAPGSGCLLPMSIINPVQVSTLHHQPKATEPLLLVPASALSLATTSNLSLPNSLVSTKVHPSTSLQYGQQLLFNNAQLPFVLKSPVSAVQLSQQPLQVQDGTQSIIVLPIGTNDAEAKEKNSNSSPENVSADSTYQQNQAKKWRTAHRRNKRKRHTISAICSLRDKLKTRSNSSSEIDAIISPNTDISNTHTENDPNDVLCGKIKNPDISQIISNLPPGWHVIGFTGLDQLGGALPTPAIPPTTASSQFQMSSITSNISSYLKAPEIKPSLVSINLNNTSHPVASEAYDNCVVNDLTCSVKLDDIPCTHVISIKTECTEEEEAKPDSTSDEQTVKRTKDKVSNQRKSRANSSDHRLEKSRPVVPVSKLDKKATVEMGNSCQSSYSHSSSVLPKPVSSDEQWTIVGVTSIPALPVSNVPHQSQAPLGTTTVTSSSPDSNPGKTQNSDQSLDTIILKIPLCPTSVTSASPSQRRRKAHKTSLTKHSQAASVASLLQSANSKGCSDRDTCDSSKPEEIKWTIVGLTQSSLDPNDGSRSSQQILEHRNPPVLSHGADITGIAKTSVKPLSLANVEHVLNSNLFNLVSPLQNTNPFLIQSAFNPNSSAFEIENQSKSLCSETGQMAEVSSNPADLFGSNPSQSQWKVVGVAPLGVPSASVTPFSSLAQLGPLSPVLPMPFLIPTASNLTVPCMGTVSSSRNTMTSNVTSSVSSPSSTTSSNYPINSLREALSNSSSVMLSTAPSARFTAMPASDIQTLQNLANQHSLDQIIQNNMANFQNPVNVLKMNEANQWNVVGVVANNQISLINTNLRNTSNQGNIDQNLISHESPEDLSMKPTSTYSKAKDSPFSGDQKTNDTVKSSSSRQSLASKPKSSEPESKICQFKCKDMIKRQQESAHMKKNTVSSLLRLKRMQEGVKENGNSEEGEHSLESSADFCETSCESEPNKSKTRSLRSYAGNRSVFTKTHSKDGLEKISLRSGTQVPIIDYKSSEDEEMVSMTSQNEQSQFNPLVYFETKEKQHCESSTVKVAAHSAARKRKLKVPRRMVAADLDYHPFDSSSDSN